MQKKDVKEAIQRSKRLGGGPPAKTASSAWSVILHINAPFEKSPGLEAMPGWLTQQLYTELQSWLSNNLVVRMYLLKVLTEVEIVCRDPSTWLI